MGALPQYGNPDAFVWAFPSSVSVRIALDQGKLSLQRLWFYVQPSLRSMQSLESLTVTLRDSRGGELLKKLKAAAGACGDEGTRKLYTFLLYEVQPSHFFSSPAASPPRVPGTENSVKFLVFLRRRGNAVGISGALRRSFVLGESVMNLLFRVVGAPLGTGGI